MINNIQKKWLITGGAGFIGRSLSQLLIENRQRVRIIDNFKTTNKSTLAKYIDFTEVLPELVTKQFNEYVELIEGDINDPDLACKVANGADVIIHLAANTGVTPSIQNPRQDFLNNCLGVFNYLEAARQSKVKRFVFASSGAVIGQSEPPFHEELPVRPISPYGASKLSGEAYCSAYFHSFGVETVALRFSNVYGPYSSHKESVVTKFISQAMRQETLEVYGDGLQTRDFIYVDDIISAIILAATTEGIGGEIFQVASNQETTINDLCQILFPLIEKKSGLAVKAVRSQPRVGDVRRNYSDTKKANTVLGWHHKTPLEQGLVQTVDWLFNQGSRQ